MFIGRLNSGRPALATQGMPCPRRLALARLTFPLLASLFLALLTSFLPGPGARAATTAGAWTNAGDLLYPRYLHSSTVLDSGKVLVVGGSSGNGDLATAEIYDPIAGTWTATGPLTTARHSHSATLLENGKVLVAGGQGNHVNLTSAELYNPATGTWSAAASLTAARFGHSAVRLLDGKVLVAAGGGSGGPLASAERYDPATNAWSSAGNLGAARSQHAAVRLNSGKVLVIGGSQLASCELYDPATNSWAATGDLTVPRILHTATVVTGGKVLVAGGFSASSITASAEVYDPATETWSATGSMNFIRSSHAAAVLPGGRVLVAGGTSNDSLNKVLVAEIYDFATGTWSITGSLGHDRWYFGLVRFLNGRVLAVGGYAIDNGHADHPKSAEIFNPDANPGINLTPPALTFADRPTGTASASQSVTLTNSGTSPLTIGAIDTGNLNFYQTNNCPVAPATLATGAHCTIDVTFQPDFPGSYTQGVYIVSNAAGSPHQIALTGTGTGPAPGTYPLALTTSGPGTVAANPPGGQYLPGTTVQLTPTPDPGAVFLGWTADGTFRGWGSPLTITMNGSHMVNATFASAPAFPDVPDGDHAHQAIAELAGRGIVKGYQDGTFGPTDPLLRAQMAALIARAMGWDGEDHGNAFPDQGSVDADLWRNVGTLAFYGVAKGYPDGSYGPTDPVLRAQVVSFVTRAMVAKGYWQAQPDDPALYPNVPADSGHRLDIATFLHYAGALPDLPTDGPFADWDQPATRAWFARTLWQALNHYFGATVTIP